MCPHFGQICSLSRNKVCSLSSRHNAGDDLSFFEQNRYLQVNDHFQIVSAFAQVVAFPIHQRHRSMKQTCEAVLCRPQSYRRASHLSDLEFKKVFFKFIMFGVFFFRTDSVRSESSTVVSFANQ